MKRFPLSLALFTLIAVPDSGLSQNRAAVDKLDQLTLEEKAALVTGQNAWQTHAVPRLDIAAAWMADGPVGLRKATGIGLKAQVVATCFPSSSAMASTWNPELIEALGAGIGAEARSHDVTLLLAPGLNLKRHPLGGRNFEYYSEDPFLSGTIAAAFVRGVQSQGVGATLKHFAVNNQERLRMTIDAQLDERTLHELYLRGFEIAVASGRPQAVMSAYNRVNGTYATQNALLLTEILRRQWGFDGMVVSDWGAVDDPIASIAAGMDLEMPGNPLTPPRVVQAVRNGKLAEADLDRAVAKVLQLADRQAAMNETTPVVSREANHDLARRVAIEAMVLLVNDGTLPITSATKRRIAVVGNQAFRPRIQGIGSSQVNTDTIDVPWTSVSQIGGAQGHELDAWQQEYSEDGLTEAEESDLDEFMRERDLVLVFAGQKASHDAEAWDRPSMDIAPGDLQILAAVRASGIPFVVVLTGGGAIDVRPIAGSANAIVMGWLGGEAWGSAVAQVLFGESAPAGKLSETFARSVADHASAINFPGGPRAVRYGEGPYVGYRYFQTYDREVAYPFGHGLSYARFEVDSARAPETLDTVSGDIAVALRVTNVGEHRGAETVQVYSRQLEPSLPRPDRELVGFRKVWLEPGESQEIIVPIAPERLAYYHDGHHRWVIEPGEYELLIGVSATDIRATLPMELTAGTLPRTVFTLDSVIGEILRDARGRAVMDLLIREQEGTPLSMARSDPFFAAILANLPFKKISNFSQGEVTEARLGQLLKLINSDMTVEQVTGVLEETAPAPGE